MSTQPPPRRRRIAGENKPGDAEAKPQARKAVPPRTPVRPAVPTPKPAPSRREREEKKAADRESAKATGRESAKATGRESAKPTGRESAKTVATPAPSVRRPSRPSRAAAAPAEVRRVDAADTADDATDDATSAKAGRRRPTLAMLLPVLVLVLGLVAAGAGYWQMQRSASLSQGDAQDAADAAATAVEAVLSFDYRDLDAYEAEVEGLLTDNYVSEELEPSLASLREQAPAAQVQVETTAQASAPETCRGECPAGEASVLVVIDKVTLTANLEAPSVTPQRLRVDMVEQDGRWLVDSIAYIGA